MTSDQAYLLDLFVDYVKDCKPDAVVVAGDVYDRAVPHPDAVSLLDDVLCRLVLGCKIPTVLIAGNHDSPERVGFGSKLLEQQGLHVAGNVVVRPRVIGLADEYGPVHFVALPYAEPATVRECLDDPTLHDHDMAERARVKMARSLVPEGERSVLVGHAFVVGGKDSESERPLSVGGAGTVSASSYDGFDFVALGHLHRPQVLGDGRIHYAGSLMKYSFSEANHQKSVSLVEMVRDGSCTIEKTHLAPKRDLRCIEGQMADLLAAATDDPRRDDYLKVDLLDAGPVLDAIGRLREVYPNVLHIDRPNIHTAGDGRLYEGDHRNLDDADLFAQFFEAVTGAVLTDEQSRAFASIVSELEREGREVDE